MTGDLAGMLARGASAEGMLRALAEHLDAEWAQWLTVYGDPATGELDRQEAYGRLLALHAPRALLTSAVEIWDRQPPNGHTVVPINARQ